MRRTRTPLLGLASALCVGAVPAPVHAQDPGRGARLYLGLPDGGPSCVECHGPDPGLDRNRLLNAAQGPAAIDFALRRAAAMGYLTDRLSSADKADVSAWLALVLGDVDASALSTVWPWGLEWGQVAPGAAVAAQPVRFRNRGATPVALAPSLRALAPGGVQGLSLSHDCPAVLPPAAECAAQVSLVAGVEGRLQAALEWGPSGQALRPVGVSATVSLAAAGKAQWQDPLPNSVVMLEAAPGVTVSTTVRLQNTGTAALTLGVPAITGPGRGAWRVDAGGCAANQTLLPMASCDIRLSATAPAAGSLEALLQWRNDGQHALPRRLLVKTVAVEAPAPPAPPPPPPPAPAPPAAPAPSPAPSPAPIPPPPASPSGGGGCSVAHAPLRGKDPLLPGLLMLALAGLWARRRAVPGSMTLSASTPVG